MRSSSNFRRCSASVRSRASPPKQGLECTRCASQHCAGRVSAARGHCSARRPAQCRLVRSPNRKDGRSPNRVPRHHRSSSPTIPHAPLYRNHLWNGRNGTAKLTENGAFTSTENNGVYGTSYGRINYGPATLQDDPGCPGVGHARRLSPLRAYGDRRRERIRRLTSFRSDCAAVSAGADKISRGNPVEQGRIPCSMRLSTRRSISLSDNSGCSR